MRIPPGGGDAGPYVDSRKGGHAKMAAATGGLFMQLHAHSLPHPPSISVDYPAGVLLSQAILLGLFQRERTGEGVEVSTDLFSAAALTHVWAGGAVLNPQFSMMGRRDLSATEKSIRNAWQTLDGHIEISPVFSPDALRDISLGLGLGDLSEDPRFATSEARLENAAELEALMEERFRKKCTADWLDILESAGVLCAEIKTIGGNAPGFPTPGQRHDPIRRPSAHRAVFG